MVLLLYLGNITNDKYNKTTLIKIHSFRYFSCNQSPGGSPIYKYTIFFLIPHDHCPTLKPWHFLTQNWYFQLDLNSVAFF